MAGDRASVTARHAMLAAVMLWMAGAAGSRPVSLQDLLALESAGGAEVSPDGRIVAYRRTQVDSKADRYDSDLWIMQSDGSGARLLEDAWSPVWMPDGRLSYLTQGPAGTSIVTRKIDGVGPKMAGTPVPVQIEGPTPSGVKWAPDGRHFAYVALAPRTDDPWPIDLPKGPEGAKWGPAPTVVTGLHFRTGVDQVRSADRHIFVAPAEGGKARQLTAGAWHVGAYYSGTGFGTSVEWMPGSDAIVFEGWPVAEDDIRSAQRSRINRVDLRTGEIVALSNLDGFWRLPRVSPDGRLIAYTGNAVTGAAFERQQLRVMNADGSGDRLLIEDMPDRLFQLQWAREGDAILASVNNKGATELWRIDLAGRVTVLAGGRQRFYISSVAPGVAFGSLTSQTRDSEIASVDLRSGVVRRLTDHARLSEELDLAQAEEIWARSADGTPVQGWLYRPTAAGPPKRRPLILDIHGGPDAMVGHDFDFRYQDFAARGYLVAVSNPGGSTGYGAKFANRIQGGFPGTKDREDLEAFLAALVATGEVDPERIHVMGCSGGGALAAWLAAKPGRFAAAAVMCPVTNWISMAGTTDVAAWAYTRFDRPFWEDPRPWLKHSPLMQAGRIETPILFANGARDQRTPTTQAAELYTALKTRGVPTRLLIFPNEGHGPWRSTPSNLMRLQLYIDEWFRTKGLPAGASPPAGAAFDKPVERREGR